MKYPLDFIHNFEWLNCKADDRQRNKGAINREMVLKNVVLRRIFEIRQFKLKPKLHEVLQRLR